MTLIAKVKPEKRKEFIDAMQSLQPMRNHLRGIRRSDLYEGNDRNTFRLVDEWETREDIDRYRQDESFRVFLGALKILCTETEIKFGSVKAEKVNLRKTSDRLESEKKLDTDLRSKFQGMFRKKSELT